MSKGIGTNNCFIIEDESIELPFKRNNSVLINNNANSLFVTENPH